jgi:toxin ParE1/3/4
MRRLRILAEANAAIDEQFRWYAEHGGRRVASRFLAALDTMMRGLLAKPRRGRVYMSARAELAGLRFPPMRRFPFLVFYRATRGGIEVVHVLHGARDVGLIFE